MDSVAKVRLQPRISLNKLGEYLVASPARRKRIIQDSKYPSGFIVARYTEAENAIIDWICAGANDDVLLANAIARLSSQQPSSNFAKSKRELCLAAIAKTAALKECLQLPGGRVQIIRGGNFASHLELSGVRVSVRPEILCIQGTGEQRTLGAIKLCFSKTHPLKTRAAEYVSAILKAHLEAHAQNYSVDNKCVKVIDVFSTSVYSLPKSFKQRLKDADAACEEIKQRWASIGR